MSINMFTLMHDSYIVVHEHEHINHYAIDKSLQ